MAIGWENDNRRDYAAVTSNSQRLFLRLQALLELSYILVFIVGYSEINESIY